MIDRHEQAVTVVRSATTDIVEDMQAKGWHRCSEVLSEDAAIVEVEDQLGDPDYAVAVTRTCSGYIVWTASDD